MFRKIQIIFQFHSYVAKAVPCIIAFQKIDTRKPLNPQKYSVDLLYDFLSSLMTERIKLLIHF